MTSTLDAFAFALQPLLEATLRSSALIAIAALVALMLRRAPAALRHLVWTLALAGCVAMPLASRVVPGWSLPGLPALGEWGEPTPQPAREEALSSPAHAVSRAAAQPSVVAPPDRTSPARPARAWRPSRADVLRAVPFVWLAGGLLILARYLLGWIWLSRVARDASRVTEPAWIKALARHGTRLGLRRLPALRVSPRIAVPIVCGARQPAIVLPEAALAWSAERRDAVLLHELAHVRRLDLVTARVTQIAATLYWFNPLVWLAARAQRAEAERACDDQVLDAGGRASTYASDLLEIARAVGGRESLDAAALAMARRSQLEGRLLAILDPGLRRGGARPATVLIGALVAAGAIAALAAGRPAASAAQVDADAAADRVEPAATTADAEPTPPTAVAYPAPGAVPATHAESSSITARPGDGVVASAARKLVADGSHSSTSKVGNWSYRDDHGTQLISRGTVRYNSNLDDVESISPDGWVQFEDKRETKWHKATFRNRAGGIERSYQVDGAERPWDASARAWLAEFLVAIDRSSGAMIEQRFPKLMKEGGPDRVLREVSVMTSDYGRGLYLRKLAASGLDDAAMRRTVSQAGREIESDYELAQTLIEAAEQKVPMGAASGAAYLEATNSLQSDYERGRALQALIQRRELSPALLDGAITSASRMESDYERAQFMIAMAEQGHVKAPSQRAYIRATHSMQSDYEKGRVLHALLAGERLAGENVGLLLSATATFQSDYERANVLVQLAQSVPLSQPQRAAFVESTQGMSSDHERERALAALAKTLSQ